MSETHHLTIGRFAPVHAGHAMMINHVLNAAKHDNSKHTILTTATHDSNKNPLTPEQKVKHLKRAFPSAHVEALSKSHPTLLHHLSKLHSQGVKNIVVHAGSDRAHEYHNLIHKYNGVEGRHGHFKFDSIKVKTVGSARTDADEGVAGASATKMRKAAASGNEKAFHAMAPSSMSTTHKREMYKDVRRGLGIHEAKSFSAWLSEGMTLPGGGVRGLGSISGNADLSGFQDEYTQNTVVDTDNRNNNIFQRLKQHLDMHKKERPDGTNKSE